MKELAIMLVALAGFALAHYIFTRVGRGAGKLVFLAIRKPLIRVMTPRYRKKAIRQLQEERKKRGLPPMENPDVL
jgi:hypothetical protein